MSDDCRVWLRLGAHLVLLGFAVGVATGAGLGLATLWRVTTA